MCYGCNNPEVIRYGSIIGVRQEKLDYYKQLHANPWPEIVQKLQEVNIHNYSIYLKQMDDGKHYLFSYFEYTGDNFETDAAKLAEDDMIKKWWKETDPCQFPLKSRKKDEWWASMEEVYHSE